MGWTNRRTTQKHGHSYSPTWRHKKNKKCKIETQQPSDSVATRTTTVRCLYRVCANAPPPYLCIICDCETRDLLAVALQMSLTSRVKVLHHHNTATRVSKQTCNKNQLLDFFHTFHLISIQVLILLFRLALVSILGNFSVYILYCLQQLCISILQPTFYTYFILILKYSQKYIHSFCFTFSIL